MSRLKNKLEWPLLLQLLVMYPLRKPEWRRRSRERSLLRGPLKRWDKSEKKREKTMIWARLVDSGKLYR